MYNVFYEEKVIYSLKSFIDSYKMSYIRLIEDSGLTVETQLINNYILLGDNLYKSILDKIEEAIKDDIILGRGISNNCINYIIVRANNFRVFVYYSENLLFKNRTIIDIEFFRK